MDWSAAHSEYVLAAYALALAVWLWCLADTWRGARKAKRVGK